jgi:hypothetical protein
MIALIIWLLLALLLIVVVKYVIAELGLPGNIQMIILLIVAVVILLFILQRFGVFA